MFGTLNLTFIKNLYYKPHTVLLSSKIVELQRTICVSVCFQLILNSYRIEVKQTYDDNDIE